MKRLLSLSLLAALVLGGGCAGREVSMQDVTHSETIILRKKPEQRSIVSLSIAGRGSISHAAV